jgi:hypothetical protein
MRPLAALLAIPAIVLLARPAAADVIDGTWCHANDGRSFQIAGPQIVTWGGTRMTGDYDRHGFRYTIPGNEKGAGGKVVMRLMGEEAVQVSVDSAEPQVWSRCRPVS